MAFSGEPREIRTLRSRQPQERSIELFNTQFRRRPSEALGGELK
jgi:hypothetical protein